MKTLTILIGSLALLTTLAVQAEDDVRIDQAVKLQQEGVIQPFEQLNGAALAAHPGAQIDETELEQEHGRYVYKVELRDAQGKKWDVELDASNGAVLSNREDD